MDPSATLTFDGRSRQPRHLWFFTLEDVQNSAFKQHHEIIDSIGSIKYLGLGLFLLYTRQNTERIQDYDFYMLSVSMPKAIRLTTDKSVCKTYKKYCRKDTSIQIIIRPAGSLSPNKAYAASHQETEAQRLAIIKKTYTNSSYPWLPYYYIQPKISSVDKNTACLIVDDSTYVPLERAVLVQLIKNAHTENKTLIDLPIYILDEEREVKTFTLTAKAWKQLAHSPWKKDLACLWKSYKAELKMEAREKSCLWQLLIEIGLARPGKPHGCDKCKEMGRGGKSENDEKEDVLVTTQSNDSYNIDESETEPFPLWMNGW